MQINPIPEEALEQRKVVLAGGIVQHRPLRFQSRLKQREQLEVREVEIVKSQPCDFAATREASDIAWLAAHTDCRTALHLLRRC